MKDVIKRKTAINAKGFAGVYGCTDFVGAGHTRSFIGRMNHWKSS